MSNIIILQGGGRMCLDDICSENISIDDIAHSLSQQCRFNGHTSEFYSVAQHSLAVEFVVRKMGYGLCEQLFAIIHDAEEAYVGDITRPVWKEIGFDSLSPLESRVRQAIAARFGISTGHGYGSMVHSQICAVDNAMLLVEGFNLLPSIHWLLNAANEQVDKILPHAVAAFDYVRRMSIGEAKACYKRRLESILNERKELVSC